VECPATHHPPFYQFCPAARPAAAGHAVGVTALRPDLQHPGLGCCERLTGHGRGGHAGLWYRHLASPVCQHLSRQCAGAVAEPPGSTPASSAITDSLWSMDRGCRLVSFLTQRKILPNIPAAFFPHRRIPTGRRYETYFCCSKSAAWYPTTLPNLLPECFVPAAVTE